MSLDIVWEQPMLTYLAGVLTACLVFVLHRRLTRRRATNPPNRILDFMWLARALDHRFALVASLGACVLIMVTNFLVATVGPRSMGGETGDIFGLSTAVFTAISVLLFAATLLAQTRQLAEQRVEIALQSKHLAEQLAAQWEPFLAVDLRGAQGLALAASLSDTDPGAIVLIVSTPTLRVENIGSGVAFGVHVRTVSLTRAEWQSVTTILREGGDDEALWNHHWWTNRTPMSHIGPESEAHDMDLEIELSPVSADWADRKPMHAIVLCTCFDRWGQSWGFWLGLRVFMASAPDEVRRESRNVARTIVSDGPDWVDVDTHVTVARLGSFFVTAGGTIEPVRSPAPK